jgi:alkylhydroperoxidase family enzyme
MNLLWPLSPRIAQWISYRVAGAEPLPVSGPHAITAYLALSRLPGFARPLDGRTSLLAAQLAAELSECRWCIERCRHDWRAAGLSQELYQRLTDYSVSRVFTERERGALAFVEAVARSQICAGQPDELVLERARQIFTDAELAELTAIVAQHHCLESLDSNLSGS